MARPTNASVAQKRLEQLNTTHELWEKYRPEWAFFLSAYEGNSSFINSNVFKHFREQQDDYNDRVKRLHYINYCDVLVDFFTNFIFSEPIDRHGGTNTFYDSFVKNVDRKGTNIDKFMANVSDDMQIYGVSYVLVDAPPSPQVLSKAEEDLIRPYWVRVTPFELIDWVLDPFGNFAYVKRKQKYQTIENGRKVTILKFTEYTKDTVKITNFDVSDPAVPIIISDEPPIPNPVLTIPIVGVRYKESKIDPEMGVSFLNTFAKNNRAILNYTSMLEEFLYRQCFNILTKQTSGFSDGSEPSLTLGTTNFLEYPEGAQAPQYISPPVAPAEFIQSEIQRIKQEMFSRASQDTINELFNGTKSSGFSQSQQFAKTVPFISRRADSLELFENQLMELTCQFTGTNWDGKVKYKDRYEITNLADSLTQLLIIFNDMKVPSETFVKEELKRVCREFDSKLPQEIREKIELEISEMDFDKWEERTDKNKTSPGQQQKSKQTGTMMEAAKESNQAGSTNKLKT